MGEISKADEIVARYDRTDFDSVFNEGIRILTIIKGGALSNFEIQIFRDCVRDAYEVVSVGNHTIKSLGNAAESLFYLRYLGIAGYKEIPGVSKNDIDEGWEKALGKYWRNREADKVAISPGHDPHKYGDHYFVDAGTEEEMRRNKMKLDGAKMESLRREKKQGLEDFYKDYSALALVNELDEKFRILVSSVESSGGSIHGLKDYWQTAVSIEEELKERGGEEKLGELDEETRGDIIDLMIILNY